MMVEKLQGMMIFAGILIVEINILALALWIMVIQDRKDNDIY